MLSHRYIATRIFFIVLTINITLLCKAEVIDTLVMNGDDIRQQIFPAPLWRQITPILKT